MSNQLYALEEENERLKEEMERVREDEADERDRLEQLSIALKQASAVPECELHYPLTSPVEGRSAESRPPRVDRPLQHP